ncbi:hypothetical protein D9M72_415680 [compost metagenome]
MNWPKKLASAVGDPGILAFRVDADHRAIGREQIRNDGSHTLAGSCRRHGQQMGRTIITHELSRLAIATDQEAGAGSRKRSDFVVGGKARRAVRVVSGVPEAEDEGTRNETEEECGEQQQRNEIEYHEGNRTRADAAHLREKEAAPETDDEQRGEEEKENTKQRFPDPKGRGEKSNDSPKRVTRDLAHHVFKSSPCECHLIHPRILAWCGRRQHFPD